MGTPFRGPPFLQSGISTPQRALFLWKRKVLSMATQLVDLNLVKITAWLEIQGMAAKLKEATDFYREPGDFCRSHTLKLHFNPCLQLPRPYLTVVKIPESGSWSGSATESNGLLLVRHPAFKNFVSRPIRRQLLELSAEFVESPLKISASASWSRSPQKSNQLSYIPPLQKKLSVLWFILLTDKFNKAKNVNSLAEVKKQRSR